jgi:hypothetical protein
MLIVSMEIFILEGGLKKIVTPVAKEPEYSNGSPVTVLAIGTRYWPSLLWRFR